LKVSQVLAAEHVDSDHVQSRADSVARAKDRVQDNSSAAVSLRIVDFNVEATCATLLHRATSSDRTERCLPPGYASLDTFPKRDFINSIGSVEREECNLLEDLPFRKFVNDSHADISGEAKFFHRLTLKNLLQDAVGRAN